MCILKLYEKAFLSAKYVFCEIANWVSVGLLCVLAYLLWFGLLCSQTNTHHHNECEESENDGEVQEVNIFDDVRPGVALVAQWCRIDEIQNHPYTAHHHAHYQTPECTLHQHHREKKIRWCVCYLLIIYIIKYIIFPQKLIRNSVYIKCCMGIYQWFRHDQVHPCVHNVVCIWVCVCD